MSFYSQLRSRNWQGFIVNRSESVIEKTQNYFNAVKKNSKLLVIFYETSLNVCDIFSRYESRASVKVSGTFPHNLAQLCKIKFPSQAKVSKDWTRRCWVCRWERVSPYHETLFNVKLQTWSDPFWCRRTNRQERGCRPCRSDMSTDLIESIIEYPTRAFDYPIQISLSTVCAIESPFSVRIWGQIFSRDGRDKN